ncbi:MAG: flagellar hook-basal body complex protein [Ancalomicrobiaceae bacterium]|nr:flagellar hook-basal body complex protein [Ancalomicrobiaceae bacterium]
MGLFGAMTTAVAGLQAQSYALENISGNIANSQTTAFKRTDTTFMDMVTSVGSLPSQQTSGSVSAFSQLMISKQGPVNATSVPTNMAINGDGFFQVQQKTGEVDGAETFTGVDVYTRSGDFTMDKQGYLVNGGGYYLKAIPIDPRTGNPTGSTASVIQISTGYLKANPSTAITYEANLPATPSVGLLQRSSFSADPTNQPAVAATSATVTGSASYNDINLSTNADNRYSFIVSDGTNPVTVTLQPSDDVTGPGTGKINMADAITAINTQLAAATPASTVTASAGTGADAGKIVFTDSGTGVGSTITISSEAATGTNVAAMATDLGFSTSGVTVNGTNALNAGTNGVEAQDNSNFLQQSLSGSSLTCYTAGGTPVDVQMRWAKVSNSPSTWNLFYQSSTTATGAATMWTNTGTSVVFNAGGVMTSPTSGKLSIPNLAVDGTTLGSIDVKFGTSGLTQYDSSSGSVNVSTLTQDGYTSGSLTSVGVDEQGRITAAYSNGVQVAIAAVPLYKFNGESALKKLNGGAYSPTDLSGSPVQMATTSITGGALEGSNTDIADEFSKMIVTQQAYSANSKIITTANSMMQDVMNIIR